MPFPYLAPLKSWTVDVLEDRERNPIENHFKRPWAVLTSGAKVIKSSSAAKNADERAKEINDIVSKTTEGTGEYSGCIIRSNVNPDFNYQLNKTIVGFDFNGKPIEVEGEENRRVSTPIVESIEIDTDGANNTLKTAKVSVKCFSLKQFEMFELFFCKPGMNVLIEFGDNTLETKTYKDTIDSIQERPKAFKSVTQAIIAKTSYSDFIKTFKDYYRADTTALKNYLQRVESARGTYDLVAGKVTDYSFSIQSDGSYEVSIEISQGNQMSLAIPINISNKDSKVVGQNKNAKNNIEQWALQLASDLNLNLNTNGSDLKGLEKEFFNWGKISETKKEETASIEPYISFRFVLEFLMNYSINETGGYSKETFKLNLPKYKVGSTDKEIIPIRIHKNLISSLYPVNASKLFNNPNKDITHFVCVCILAGIHILKIGINYII